MGARGELPNLTNHQHVEQNSTSIMGPVKHALPNDGEGDEMSANEEQPSGKRARFIDHVSSNEAILPLFMTVPKTSSNPPFRIPSKKRDREYEEREEIQRMSKRSRTDEDKTVVFHNALAILHQKKRIREAESTPLPKSKEDMPAMGLSVKHGEQASNPESYSMASATAPATSVDKTSSMSKKNRKYKESKNSREANLPSQRGKRKGIFPFIKLPLELQEQIFGHMHPITSACAGVTCRSLYPIHYKLHGPVPVLLRPPKPKIGHLAFLLGAWMAKSGFKLRRGKFYRDNEYRAKKKRRENYAREKWEKKKERKDEKKKLKEAERRISKLSRSGS